MRIAVIMFLFLAGVLLFTPQNSWGQVPTINPEQTVNPATGEMGFSMPLASVNDVVRSFPINLKYQAGIRIHQDASEVGLGFDISAGSIIRSTVHVPDNSIGYREWNDKEPDCNMDKWRQILTEILFVVGIVATVLTLGAAGTVFATVGLVLGAVTTVVGVGLTVYSMFCTSPINYNAGGPHTPKYNFSDGQGIGYFKGGEITDVPDVYFISTPFVSGQMIPIKKEGNIVTFVLQQSTGSVLADNAITQIHYNTDLENFRIELPDGMRLFFDLSDTECYTSKVKTSWRINESNTDCEAESKFGQRIPAATRWHLTKVLYSDFQGDETAPENSTSGGWIILDYKKIEGALAQWNHGPVQSSMREVVETWRGTYAPMQMNFSIHFYYLEKIRTSNESATFNYTDDRKDNFWMRLDSTGSEPDGPYDIDYFCYSTLVQLPRLTSLSIRTKENTLKKELLFETDYELKRNSLNSRYPYYRDAQVCHLDESMNGISGNEGKGCLTLKKIYIKDGNGGYLPPIEFNYSYNPELQWSTGTVTHGKNIGKPTYRVEPMDMSGYYCPAGLSANQNDRNTEGTFDKAKLAHAWSLTGVTLPTGMKLTWNYEPNRYDAVNGVTLAQGNAPQVLKYGSGIRVRDLQVTDLLSSKNYSLTYVYTDVDGEFNEVVNSVSKLTNSSGHLTVEPFNTLKTDPFTRAYDDYRIQEKWRGGFYTPSKLLYEKVQVIKNYKTSAPNAPYGYNVQSFTTPKEYPNLYRYGTYDRSCLFGLLVTSKVYDYNNSLLQTTTNKYHFVKGYPLFMPVTGYGIEWGWIRKKSTSSLKMGVLVSESNYYADDLSESSDMVSKQGEIELGIIGVSEIPKAYVEACHNSRAGFSICTELLSNNTNVFICNGFGNVNEQDVVVVSYQTVLCDDPYDASEQYCENRVGAYILVDIDWENCTSGLQSNLLCNFYDVNEGTSDCPAAWDGKLYLYDDNKNGIPDLVIGGNYIIQDIKLQSGKYTGSFVKKTVASPGASLVNTYSDGSKLTVTNYETGASGCIVKRIGNLYVDFNGQPNQVTVSDADGTILKTEYNIPAYTRYPELKSISKNLIAPFQTVTYSGTKTNSKIVQAAASTWKDFGNGVWHPYKQFSWESSYKADGSPEKTFADFVHTSVTNPNWKPSGETTLFDAYGRVEESKSITGVYSATIYGQNNLYPVATVVNARKGECVYTSFEDWDDQNIASQKSSNNSVNATIVSATSSDIPPSGSKYLTITGTAGSSDQYIAMDYTPSNADIAAGKKICWEFWAKASVENTPTFTSIQTLEDGNNWGQYREPLTVSTTWQKFRFVKTLDAALANKQFRVVLRPPYDGAFKAGSISYDGIRAYPADAQMVSTTYDPVLGVITSQTDANNYTTRTEYDGFGRVKAQYNTLGKKVKEYDYHLMGEN